MKTEFHGDVKGVEQLGYQLGMGFARAAGAIFLIGFAIVTVITVLRNNFDWGTDDSDFNGWARSGLVIHTDYKTGVQYLKAPGGAITPRLDADGKPVNIYEPRRTD
jgi:hypothetical protein